MRRVILVSCAVCYNSRLAHRAIINAQGKRCKQECKAGGCTALSVLMTNQSISLPRGHMVHGYKSQRQRIEYNNDIPVLNNVASILYSDRYKLKITDTSLWALINTEPFNSYESTL